MADDKKDGSGGLTQWDRTEDGGIADTAKKGLNEGKGFINKGFKAADAVGYTNPQVTAAKNALNAPVEKINKEKEKQDKKEGKTKQTDVEERAYTTGQMKSTNGDNVNIVEQKISSFVLVIGFVVNNTAAYDKASNTQDLSIDDGHAFFYISYKKLIYSCFSFGPADDMDKNHMTLLGRVVGMFYPPATDRPATLNYKINKKSKLFRFDISKAQAEAIKEQVDKFQAKVTAFEQYYSAYKNDTCAAMARKVLLDAHIKTPEGKCKIQWEAFESKQLMFLYEARNYAMTAATWTMSEFKEIDTAFGTKLTTKFKILSTITSDAPFKSGGMNYAYSKIKTVLGKFTAVPEKHQVAKAGATKEQLEDGSGYSMQKNEDGFYLAPKDGLYVTPYKWFEDFKEKNKDIKPIELDKDTIGVLKWGNSDPLVGQTIIHGTFIEDTPITPIQPKKD